MLKAIGTLAVLVGLWALINCYAPLSDPRTVLDQIYGSVNLIGGVISGSIGFLLFKLSSKTAP